VVARSERKWRHIPREDRVRIGRQIRETRPTREQLVAMAEALGRSVRSLRNWARLDPADDVRPPGRPPLSAEVLAEARDAVESELDRQGWSAGEDPVHRGLEGRIPRARVRRVMQPMKAEHRARKREHQREARVSMRVCARDAVWSMDATHLGRDLLYREVQAEVVREVASTRSIGISAGPAASAREVIQLLERTMRERGGAPLVLMTDNGGAYIAHKLRKWCKHHRVLLLYSLPRTPQHNAASEHGMRELKEDAALGKGTLVLDMGTACAALMRSRDRIDGNRLRRTRDWKTAVEADRGNPHWTTLVSRDELWMKATCAIQLAVLHSKDGRERRRAVRAAILDSLAHFSVITRTRGGRPWTAQFAEDDS